MFKQSKEQICAVPKEWLSDLFQLYESIDYFEYDKDYLEEKGEEIEFGIMKERVQ